MDQGERRIRSLKLNSRDDTILLQARYCLEEAFRTASLPGVPPNAQVLVHRLDLGSIRVDQSSTLLASRISELMRNLTPSAICVDHQSAAMANVVWFSDSLQPYRVLLERVLDGKELHEWYWHTLFPKRSLALNSAVIELALLQSITTPLKGLAASRLLQDALEPRRLLRLFPFITEKLALRLLHEQGVSLDGVAGTTPQTGVPPASCKACETRMIAAPNLSQGWRYGLQQAVQCWGKQNVRTLWYAWQALILHQPAYQQQRNMLHRIAPGQWLGSWSSHSAGVTENRSEITMNAAAVNTVMTVKRDSPSLPKRSALPEEPGIDSAPSINSSPNIDPTASIDSTLSIIATQRVISPFSQQAGFAFIIPLLQRLGMTELLAENEILLTIDLPRQLLWALTQRFDLAESDPLLQLFDGFEPCGDITISQFCVPDCWCRLVTASGRPLKGMVGAQSIQLYRLLTLMQQLAALYLRRYCSLSLRTLVERPGRVVVTATHWDVIFDINQIDLRLRRVALDNDPGWVLWLGRVLQFHYDSEGQRYV